MGRCKGGGEAGGGGARPQAEAEKRTPAISPGAGTARAPRALCGSSRRRGAAIIVTGKAPRGVPSRVPGRRCMHHFAAAMCCGTLHHEQPGLLRLLSRIFVSQVGRSPQKISSPALSANGLQRTHGWWVRWEEGSGT